MDPDTIWLVILSGILPKSPNQAFSFQQHPMIYTRMWIRIIFQKHVCNLKSTATIYRIKSMILQSWDETREEVQTVSQIWSLMGLLSMVIILAPNSTPMVRSCTGWNRLSVNCSRRHDFPTPAQQTSQQTRINRKITTISKSWTRDLIHSEKKNTSIRFARSKSNFNIQ